MSQRSVPVAPLYEEGFAVRWSALTRRMKYLGDLTPAFRRHREALP
jgi:hypothetical protein